MIKSIESEKQKLLESLQQQKDENNLLNVF